MLAALDGDLSLVAGPVLTEQMAGRVRVEQVAQVARYTPGMMLANACAAPVLAAALWPSPARWAALAWAAVMIAIAAAFGLGQRRRKARPKPTSASGRGVRLTIRNAAVLGLLWSSAPVTFFGDATHGGQLVIASVSAGVLCAGALALASIPLAAMAFTVPIYAAVGTNLIVDGDPTSLFGAVLVLVYAAIITVAVFSHGLHLVARTVSHIETEQRVRTDALTGLPNRVEFQDRLEALCAAASNDGTPFAVLCLDLDSFKAVNDTLGHEAGDQLLKEAASRLRRCARSGDLVARLGGDEFAILASGAARFFAGQLAARITEAFQEPFFLDGKETITTVSVGVALAPHDGLATRSLMKCADIALYRAKHSRGGSFQMFEPTLEQHARERRATGQQLRNALHRGELRLAFQPFLHLRENRLVGCEALVRWQHPHRGLISPAEFIPIAEETGLIQPLGEWVLREACRVARSWPDEVRVAVNLSPAQLREPGIVSTVLNALAETGIAPSRLEVEVTETALISDEGTSVAVLRALSQLGIQVALDDFGTGYSSLSYLRKLPLNRIKIDRSFVADLLHDPDARSIVKAVISLADDLRMSTTAEGVEEVEQLAALREQNCTEAQGFLISRPISADEVTELLLSPKFSSRAA
ncbi:MAG TPA: EAL domain-containing protein [Beijerinckiaceae bacterium]|nr:EAL domain-containing protein [Beijerinckiaceae bacterium]